MPRLPAQPHEWIDRSRRLTFRFEGETYHGYAGDVISTALWACGVRMLGRSFKYHRPRGIYSLAGHDANVMFEDDRRTNIRGDLVQLEEGMDLRAVNTWGGLAEDRLRWVERFSAMMPVGFYYKAFHTPRWAFPFHERQIRKVAGLGAIKPQEMSPAKRKDYAFCELLVIGGGPAGMAAAVAAAEQGVRVLLVDENARLGGSLAWQWASDPEALTAGRELIAQVEAHENIAVRLAAQVAGCYADHWVAVVDDERLTKLRARTVLAATGCIEQPAVFGNNDLPGVMLGSAAQRLIHQYAVKPCDRCVVLAGNSDAYRLALDLHDKGVVVAAIVDLRGSGEESPLGIEVRRKGIPIQEHATIYEAIAAGGKQSVLGASVCPLTRDGLPDTGRLQRIDCDGIAMSVGWTPTAGSLYQAGGRFRYVEAVEQLVPVDLPPTVFAAGRVRGVYALADQLADGRRAGLAAARQLGKYSGPLPDALESDAVPRSHPAPFVAHPKHKNFVDLDEDLHLADLVNAHQEGYDNIELLKRYTTLGMGPSQGKLANMNGVRVLAQLNGKSINETGTTTARPFHRPVSLAHLAGRRFHPQRRTPLHEWHAQEGAQFMDAGNWLRPEYYVASAETSDRAANGNGTASNGTASHDGASRNRAACILGEATHVRQAAGLIDVSTLGKFEIRGPDAARFLERIYTGRFAKQPAGKLRYALACDETGVIIDDGIVARLSEEHFYVTATTSGAAALFREMQRWAIVLGDDVALINATTQFAAMNLAGPLSREILQPLTDLDLSPEAFPYLGVRQGSVAGVPARLLRVGFVGELGYEIHVPTNYAAGVWRAIADSDPRVRPFGVEAQRLLRLEKGHFIVGQDTDALTNVYEAGAAWAIGKDKPFFVGQRSLQIMADRPLQRRLIGFRLPAEFAGPYPLENHLVIEDGQIAGRVTSFARHSTLGYALGMAMVEPRLATPGTHLTIRVAGKKQIRGEVVGMPFYDPHDLRQRELALT